MRVPDVVLKSVGFVSEIVHRDSTCILCEPYATGFIVAIPSAVAGHFFFCFVTAKHVAKDFAGKEFVVETKKKGGGVTKSMNILGTQWWTHPTDETADVAIVPFVQADDMDFAGIPPDSFVLPGMLASGRISIGDETFVTGLFTAAATDTDIMPHRATRQYRDDTNPSNSDGTWVR